MSSSSFDTPVSSASFYNNLANPDPNNYKITNCAYLGRYMVLKINYPDCTNYEGNKILVFKDTTLEQLKCQGTIDPHFSENKNKISPIARFEPTLEGERNAVVLIVALNKY